MKRKVQRITLTLQGDEVSFDSENNNRISSTGLAISTTINYGNGSLSPTAQITVYGLPLSTMNKLFRVQWNTMQAVMNTVMIEAGEQGEELSVVYNGNITFATIKFNEQGENSLVITSQMAIVDKLLYSEPYTQEDGQVEDAAQVIEKLALESKYSFENFGATKAVTNVKLIGSNIEKITNLCRQCDFDLYIEQQSITICKKDGERELKIPVISPKTGLIGYPEPDQRGLNFNCAYDPLVRFGGVARIENSAIEIANADWRIYGLVATLESNIHQGKWQMSVNSTWRDSKDAAVQRK